MQVLAPAQHVAASKAMMSAQKPMDTNWNKGSEKSRCERGCRGSSLCLDVFPNRLDVVTRDHHQTILIGAEQVVALHPNATDDDRQVKGLDPHPFGAMPGLAASGQQGQLGLITGVLAACAIDHHADHAPGQSTLADLAVPHATVQPLAVVNGNHVALGDVVNIVTDATRRRALIGCAAGQELHRESPTTKGGERPRGLGVNTRALAMNAQRIQRVADHRCGQLGK